MPTDYQKLRSDNIRRYGEDIGRIGPMLLAQRYDNRSHFIFELLQNAEDALRRQTQPSCNREVSFRLESDALVFSHFGAPFTLEDVRFICGIGESTLTHAARLTDIGRFGIGFKSVYAFTDRPEIHSGDEHFAIEDYVRPCRIDPITTELGQTVFRFPFRASDPDAYDEIYVGLSSLDLSTLIFLREIEQVRWQSGSSQGNYLRETKPAPTTDAARRVTIIGESESSSALNDATYIVFERPVFNRELPDKPAGRVEVAYHLLDDRVAPVESAKLSVFFPTIVHTQFGAILQGPFRTTPSRDNIPRDDAWNKHLVTELAVLIPESIRLLKSFGKLDAQTLQALPIHRVRFSSEPLFAPVFDAVRSALKNEPLIPCTDGTCRAATNVRLGRTAEIRALFSSDQLGALHSSATPLAWVIDGVTRDRTPHLREYLNSELGIPEIEAAAILSRLQKPFLEAQTIDWLAKLYEFLAEQEGAWRATNLLDRPIIRLSDDSHVAPFEDGQPLAYLPSPAGSDFPTVHSSLSRSAPALEFLKRIGLTAPDLVDDVITNLLPRFSEDGYSASPAEYVPAVARIHAAADTNLSDKRERLLDALRATPFVFAINTATGARRRVCPPEAYIHTDRLAGLFAGIDDVWLIEKDVGTISNEIHRKLLRACGANEYLLPVVAPSRFAPAELHQMRVAADCPAINNRYPSTIIDYTLRDLDKILAHLLTLKFEARCQRALLLWEALAEVETNRGKTFFSGTYSWFHYTKRQHTFTAAFIDHLRATPWVPKPGGALGPPTEVVFEDISPAWPSHPFLLSLLSFKPRAEVELARLAGFEPDLLDLLKSRGITSRQQLAELLQLPDTADPHIAPEPAPTYSKDSADSPLYGSIEPAKPVASPIDEYAAGGRRQSGSTPDGSSANTYTGGSNGSGQSPPNPGAYRPVFHTYVAVSPEDDLADPEGLDQAARMQIEQKALNYILEKEKLLQATPPGNPGFDLFEGPDMAKATRLVEVKARSGAWTGPVALSVEQFRRAQLLGGRYWLYVVESTNDPAKTKLHRIQDPAGKARYFAFDAGWSALTVDALETAFDL